MALPRKPLEQQMAERKAERKADRASVRKAKQKEARDLTRLTDKPGAWCEKAINAKVVFELAARGLTLKSITEVLGICQQTLYNRPELSQAMSEGREARKTAALDENYRQAMSGNDKALERELKMSGAYESDATIQVNVNSQVKDTKSEDLLDYLEGRIIEGEVSDTTHPVQSELLQAPLGEASPVLEESQDDTTDIGEDEQRNSEP